MGLILSVHGFHTNTPLFLVCLEISFETCHERSERGRSRNLQRTVLQEHDHISSVPAQVGGAASSGGGIGVGIEALFCWHPIDVHLPPDLSINVGQPGIEQRRYFPSNNWDG
jgi:hypothetical protein